MKDDFKILGLYDLRIVLLFIEILKIRKVRSGVFLFVFVFI